MDGGAIKKFSRNPTGGGRGEKIISCPFGLSENFLGPWHSWARRTDFLFFLVSSCNGELTPMSGLSTQVRFFPFVPSTALLLLLGEGGSAPSIREMRREAIKTLIAPMAALCCGDRVRISFFISQSSFLEGDK